jgi:hypothetical protein
VIPMARAESVGALLRRRFHPSVCERTGGNKGYGKTPSGTWTGYLDEPTSRPGLGAIGGSTGSPPVTRPEHPR